MGDNGTHPQTFEPLSYPQLCGLCGGTSALACANHKGGPHEYVRADVLACTQLNEITSKLEIIGKLLYIQNQMLQKLIPDPNASRIVTPH